MSKIIGIMLMIGMSSVIGKLLVRTSLLKVHLWHIGYTSPIVVTAVLTLLKLQQNGLMAPLQEQTF